MSYTDQYKSKLTTAENAVKLIPKKGNLVIGLGMSEPPALLKALEQRVINKDIDALRLYYMHPATPLQTTLLKYEYMDHILPYPFYPTKTERDLVKEGLKHGKKVINYVPANFHQIPSIISHTLSMDVCIVTVSSMTNGGYFSTGTNADYTITAAKTAKKLIIEVNENMPCVFGDTFIHISQVTAIVENNVLLPNEPPHVTPGEVDTQIANHIMKIFADGSTIQIGAGNVPNAVCSQLKNYQDLGIHSELLSPVMTDLIKAGNVTNKRKNIDTGKSIYTLAAGDQEFFKFIDKNPGIEGHPSSYVNDPYIIGLNDNVFSINSFIEIDLFGQVNAEFMLGHQFSTVGGQLDFIEGAMRSKNGKTVLTAESTAGGGKFSRIVNKISGPATDTRNNVQYVATEYGMVNLMGMSTAERANLLISIAHPKFQDQLKEQAKEMDILL